MFQTEGPNSMRITHGARRHPERNEESGHGNGHGIIGERNDPGGSFPPPASHLQPPTSRFALLAIWFVLLSVHLARAEAPLAVQLFDTGMSSSAPLTPDALSRQAGWKLIPEDQIQHQFQGDVVFLNGRLAIALRQKGRGAELYTVSPKGAAMRAELVAVGSGPAADGRSGQGGRSGQLGARSVPSIPSAQSLSSVKIVENNSGSATLDATYKTAQGESLTLGYELKVGQEFVQTQPRSGVTGLWVVAPCRFAVLPDFFADDIVVDATELTVLETELPSENFLLQMVDGAVVMAVWHPAKDDVRITLSGQGKARTITGSEIHYAKEGKVFVAVINGPGSWHMREIAADEADKILHLDWKAPYIAHWRVDWRRDDNLTDSWEMLTQNPDGEYVKHGWYGQPESFGNVDWLKEGRQRWTTVLGSFLYPCWLDKNGAGYLQPLKKGVRFLGPAVIYPINRLEATPLDAFTVVDVMRDTLGVGPCEYILDVEGQKKTFQGRPTCASRTILNDIYDKKEQKQKKAEVLQTLDDVHAFVRHIRGRIGDYATFGHEMVAYLEEQKKTHTELAGILTEMQEIIHRIDGYVARRKDGIKTPEYATQLVEEFRTTLVDYEGNDAVKKCKRITAALVDIGGNQDELVGECRMVVKILRQRAAMAMATDPRVAPVAREVRRRTQQMLRNPTSYEAPRH